MNFIIINNVGEPKELIDSHLVTSKLVIIIKLYRLQTFMSKIFL